MKVARKPAAPADARKRRAPEGSARGSRPRAGTGTRPQESRGTRPRPQSAPTDRPAQRPARPKTTTQAKARAKARKAKAPKVVRPPLRERLRERLVARLDGVDLRPQALLARVPFVVLIIAALGLGLGITLWLSTDSAQRSYQLGSARALNDALTQQKDALERDVLEAQSAPALADAARDLGMIPSKDTAHLVQDGGGNWVVVGKPKPAEGAPPPPLNSKLPAVLPPAPPAAAPPAPKPGATVEVPRRVGALPGMPGAAVSTEVPVRLPLTATATAPLVVGAVTPPGLQLVPLPGPTAPDTLAAPPALVAPLAPTVAAVPNVAPVNPVVVPPAPILPGVPTQ